MSIEQAAPNTCDVHALPVSFLWLEITGKCQLYCEHCYAESGPRGSHGGMSKADWIRVIDEAAELGVKTVQFIGGEPTLHPDLAALIGQALARGLGVEVFSNLAHVSSSLWDVFTQPGVSLATSYYSDSDEEHDAITNRRGSRRRTFDGIAEALRRDIPIRVGVIGLRDDQRVEDACRQLGDLGVADVSVDHLRGVGRGVRDEPPSVEQLCGHCANGVLAVSPDGEVWPCVFARWMTVGNVKQRSLIGVATGNALSATRAKLASHFVVREIEACNPGPCTPQCMPQTCAPRCGPNRATAHQHTA